MIAIKLDSEKVKVLPENCSACSFRQLSACPFNGWKDFCKLTGDRTFVDKQKGQHRSKKCPLIEIPERTALG